MLRLSRLERVRLSKLKSTKSSSRNDRSVFQSQFYPSLYDTITTSKRGIILGRSSSNRGVRVKVKAFFFNPSDERILKQALKEPVAFMGGMFAGLLRLDLSEDPLKEWVTRTVEASGITEDEIDAPDSETEETPQQIEIE